MDFSVMVYGLAVAFAALGNGVTPLGMPPGAEDPVLAQVAPEHCLFYASWAETGKSDPKSDNQTEQLLAKPCIQEFLAECRSLSRKLLATSGADKELQQSVTGISRIVAKRPGAVFCGTNKNTAGELLQNDFVLMINVGDQVEAFKKEIAALELLLEEKMSLIPEQVQINGKAWQQWKTDEVPAPITWGFDGKYFLLAYGKDAIADTLKRTKGAVPAWLGDLRKETNIPRPSVTLFVDTGSLYKTVTKAGKALSVLPYGKRYVRMFEAWGLDKIQSVGLINGFDDAGIISKVVFRKDKSDNPLVSLIKDVPIKLDDLENIPGDSLAGAVFHVDVNKLFAFAQRLSSFADEGDEDNEEEKEKREDFKKTIEELKKVTGLDLHKELEKPLSVRIQIFNAPSEGDLYFTGMTAILQFSDKERGRRIAQAFGKLIEYKIDNNEAPGISVSKSSEAIAQCKFRGETISYFRPAIFPLLASCCVRENDVVMSLRLSVLKSVLARGKEFRSLADVPQIKEMFATGEQHSVVMVENTPKLVEFVYPLFSIYGGFGLWIANQFGGDDATDYFDMARIPPANVIYPHIKRGTITMKQTPTSTVITTRTTVAPNMAPIMAAYLGAAFISMMSFGGI